MEEMRKITIIEGPPPTFELASDPWLGGLNEGPSPTRIALCRVRTSNGPALVERCYRAWRDQGSIQLEYRSEDGLTSEAPIVAVRWLELEEGDVLLLWVRLEEDFEVEIDFEFGSLDDDFEDEDDDDDEDIGFGFSL